MNKKAFTLIETLIGITLITVVLTAVTGLVLSTMLGNQRNLHSLQALGFAEEGIEVMRYLRDSNWRQNFSWNKGFEVEDENSFYLKRVSCEPCWDVSSFERDGVVESQSGFEFVRSVSLLPVDGVEDAVEVNVIVEWDEKNVTRSVQLSSILSNWQ